MSTVYRLFSLLISLHFCEKSDSHTPNLPLQQFANCHDSSLQHSVKCLSGFQKTLPDSFSSLYSIWISGWICATIYLLMELSESRRFMCVCVLCVYGPIIQEAYWSEGVWFLGGS